MPEVTITTEQALELRVALLGAPALPGIEVLSPPPSPKGRYALAKASAALVAALKPFAGEEESLADRHCERDDKGNRVAAPGGGFKLKAGTSYHAERRELLDEEVTLAGVRQITRSELGDCPITAFHERILIATGLLEDREPDA